MPELRAGGQLWEVAAGSNLLDALRGKGIAIPFSCRAGSCHACLVRCSQGELDDQRPAALDPARRAEGWRLACQCRVLGDCAVEVFDPLRDGLPASVVGLDWPAADILRLRLQPQRPLRYQAGQHLVLWNGAVARPYSLASLPGEEPWLEFHIACQAPGAFCDAARQLRVGDELRLGELRGGALHYDPEWQERPLLLMASGTGLAPLWGILRQVVGAGHLGPIRLLHLARSPAEHYLAAELTALAQAHPDLEVTLALPTDLDAVLAQFRLVSRRTLALLCGQPASVERFARHLYLAGVPRSQILADVFLSHA